MNRVNSGNTFAMNTTTQFPQYTTTNTNTKYKYNSYFYCAPYSMTYGALQKSANTCFTAVGRLK